MQKVECRYKSFCRAFILSEYDEVVSVPLRHLTSKRVICSRDMDTDLAFMWMDLEAARASTAAGEVLIGAILVQHGAILARSRTRTIRECDPAAPAAIL